MTPAWSKTLALVLLLGAAGCYHYVPAPTAPVAQGTPIRLRLATPQSFELSALTAHNIGTVTGEWIREENGQVVLSAMWLDAVTGEGFDAGAWTFSVPRDNVADLSVRSVSRWRTLAVVAAGALATWVGWESLRGSDAGGGQPGNGGQPR